MDRIAPSARLEAQIAELLTQGLADDPERLAEVGRLGARLVLQRAVEDEVTAFLGRARYERSSDAVGQDRRCGGARDAQLAVGSGRSSGSPNSVRRNEQHWYRKDIPNYARAE